MILLAKIVLSDKTETKKMLFLIKQRCIIIQFLTKPRRCSSFHLRWRVCVALDQRRRRKDSEDRREMT